MKRIEIPKIKIEDIFLGMDPEFEELLGIHSYIPIPPSIEGDTEGAIGKDGSGDQIELRPDPSFKVSRLVRNLKNLIKGVSVPLSVKGDRYPLGAHIHFGFMDGHREEITEEVILKLCEVLDDFLGEPLLDLSGQARGRYKRLSAFEIKPWGFEYRSLPSAYLINPYICKIVLKIAKNVIKTFLRKGYIFYDYPPQKKDYMKWGGISKKEYYDFLSFITEYSQNYQGEAINSNWGGKVKFYVEVIFSDDWEEENQSQIKVTINKFYRNFFKKMKIDVIYLYGLKQSRGIVTAGFTMPQIPRIDHPFTPRVKYIYGLPWEWRMKKQTFSFWKKVLGYIIESIKKEEREP